MFNNARLVAYIFNVASSSIVKYMSHLKKPTMTPAEKSDSTNFRNDWRFQATIFDDILSTKFLKGSFV